MAQTDEQASATAAEKMTTLALAIERVQEEIDINRAHFGTDPFADDIALLLTAVRGIGELEAKRDAAIAARTAMKGGVRLVQESCEMGMATLRAALKELVRLKTWRDELGAREKAGTIYAEELRKALLTYGREKDAAWSAARALIQEEGHHG